MKKLLLIILFFFFTITFINPNPAFAEQCCDDNPYTTYDLIANKCITTSPHGLISQSIKCESTERCQNNQCIPKTAPPPIGSNCGYLYQSCCRQTTYPATPYCYGDLDCTENKCLVPKEEEENYQKPIPISCKDNTDCPESTCQIIGSDGNIFSKLCVKSDGSYATMVPSDTTKPQPCWIGENQDIEGILTAIGCIPTSIGPFVDTILTRGISIGSGLAFMLMLFGAFTLITSAGNPENTKKGGEIITSAIVGLLFIIFSVFLLKIIGVDILKLEGFS